MILAVATWMLAAPLAGLCQTTETPFAIAEAVVDLPIPDGNPVGASHTISISGSDLLESLEVALQIDHPAIGDLVISLTSPSGAKVILHNRTSSPQTPFSPVYETNTPSAESLKTFLGKSPRGNWTLIVADLVPGSTGTLMAWGLRVKPSSLIQPLPPTPVPIAEAMFEQASTLPVDALPGSAAAGDANNDGLDDLFIISETGNQASVYFSNGTALTDPPLRYSVNRPQKIALSDFNRDGQIDFAAASQTKDIAFTTLTVFLANIAGGFSQGFTAQVSTSLQKLAAFDATGDGIIDLVFGGVPHLLEGVGDGSFKPAVQLVYLAQAYWAHGDLNGDGLLDIFAEISRGGTSAKTDPHVLYGNQDPSFPIREKITLDSAILDAFPARLDRPGELEFAALTKTSAAATAYQLHTLYEESPGEIAVNTQSISTGLINLPAIPYDLNGDGLDELISVSKTGIHAFQKSFFNAGGENRTLYEIPSAKNVTVGRFFSDGGIGMAVIGSTTEVILLHSTLGPLPTPTPYATPTPTPTPFLFPTTVPATPTPTPEAPTPTPVSPTQGSPDINGDGIVDRLDLLILLEYWGQKVQ